MKRRGVGGHFRVPAVFRATAIVVLLFGTPHAHGAFGISPPFLNADHLLKGSTYMQTVYLVQDQPNVDLPITTILDISEKIRPWIRIDRGFDFVIPQGVRQFPVLISIAIPQDAELGVYSGTISFTGAPNIGGQVAIALGVQVRLNLTVGTGIHRKFSVPIVKPLDIEEGWSPRVYVKFQNDGNVAESFSGATYELFDQHGAVRLAYVQKSDDFPETPAFAVKEYSVEFPVNFHMGLGQYWADIKFYQDETFVAGERTVFNVLERGSLANSTQQFFENLRANAVPYTLALGGAVLVLIVLRRKFWRLTS